MASKKLDCYAVIDVGSNQLTLKIAEVRSRRRPRIVEVVRGSLALGRDTYKTGGIQPASLSRCCELLQGFAQKMREYDVRDWRVVATSAIREASNREYVLARIAQETGLQVEVLDNNVERFYNLRALTNDFDRFNELKREGMLLVDIGAGSLQVTQYDEGRLIYSHNLLIGALRVNEMMQQLRERTRDYGQLLDDYISCELNDYLLVEDPVPRFQHLVVIGQEMYWLRKLAGLGSEDEAIGLDAFQSLRTRLAREKTLSLTTREGIPDDVAELLLPIASILNKYTEQIALERLYLVPSDLADGLILEYAERWYNLNVARIEEEELLTLTYQLAARFRYDEAHVRYVHGVALRLFDALAKPYGLAPRQRFLLSVAAILHDIGKFVRLNHHAEQSFEIIRHVDLPGLSDTERLIVAYIARLHSGSSVPGPEAIEGLDLMQRRSVLQLAALLRLADGLDSSHRQKLGELEVRLGDTELTIHIRTDQDATLETAVSRGKGQLLMSLYGLRLRFDVRGQL